MDAQNDLTEMKDIHLQESLSIVIVDHARPAEQVLNEQETEHPLEEQLPAPRFLP